MKQQSSVLVLRSLAASGAILLAAAAAHPAAAQSKTALEAEKFLVWNLLHEGDFAKARDMLAPLVATVHDSREAGLGPKSTFYFECLSLLGAVELRTGRLAEAAAHLTEAKDGFSRKRKAFKEEYRQAVVRGQSAAFRAYAAHVLAYLCRSLDWLGEVKLEQQSFDEAHALFEEALKIRESAVAEGILPDEPVASGLMMSKHLEGLYHLRKGEHTRAHHYLDQAVKEFEGFIAAKTRAAEAARQAAEEGRPVEPPPEGEAASPELVGKIADLDQTLTHVALLSHLGEVELAEGDQAGAIGFAGRAVEVARERLGPKHGAGLEPLILIVQARVAEADRLLAANDPRGARAAIQAAAVAAAGAEQTVGRFWVAGCARRTEAERVLATLRGKAEAIDAAVAALDEAEKAADVAMTTAGADEGPKKTTTKRRVIRRVVPKKEDAAPAQDAPAKEPSAPPAAAG